MDLGKDLRDHMGRIALMLGGFGMIVMVGYSVFHKEPPVPVDYANGLYSYPECGSIAFRNGVVSFGSERVRYSLQVDKRGGVFADPEYFVGVVKRHGACSVVADHDRDGSYLKFKQAGQSQAAQLWDRDRIAADDFVREGS
jgi:hypothetical protein